MGRKNSESSSSSENEDGNETIASDLVVSKYSAAADITNAVLKAVVAAAKEGTEIGSLCDLGDSMLKAKTDKVFKNPKLQKGIAMPTCVSVNNCISHFSPLRSDVSAVLKEGDVVKIELGAHIDGYIAVAAHTVVVGASKDTKVVGKKANVVKAAYDAMEVAIRMLRPGTKTTEIMDAITKVATEYGVKPVEIMASHSMERNTIKGDKKIMQPPKPAAQEKRFGNNAASPPQYEESTIEKNDVFAIDVIFSTGLGKTTFTDARTTVFKRTNVQYSLKMKASRVFFSEAVAKYGQMPFTLRAFDDQLKALMGVVECERYRVVDPYEVLYEYDDEFVAQFKATVLVMPNGLLKISGLPLEGDFYEPSETLKDEALLKTLNSSLKPRKKKAAPKKEAAAESCDAAGDRKE